VVFNTGPYTDLPDNSILITANMQSETSFPSSHQLKSYVACKSRLKLAARAVLSADAGLLVHSSWQSDFVLTEACPSPERCHFAWGDLDPHLIHGSLGPPKSTPANGISVHPFLHSS